METIASKKHHTLVHVCEKTVTAMIKVTRVTKPRIRPPRREVSKAEDMIKYT